MSSFVYFDIPAADINRAKKFYSDVFNWKFEKAEDSSNYWMIDTADEEGECVMSGGLYQKEEPQAPILDYIGVTSVDESLEKIARLGGQVVTAKTTAPGWGYWAVCTDTENNVFGLWQDDRSAE